MMVRSLCAVFAFLLIQKDVKEETVRISNIWPYMSLTPLASAINTAQMRMAIII